MMDVQTSMDGRGRCHDNIFIERLWRSLKWELIYLKAFDDGQHLSQEVSTWFRWYNRQRPHQSLNYRTPIKCQLLWRVASIRLTG